VNNFSETLRFALGKSDIMKLQHLILLTGLAMALPAMRSSAEIKPDAGITITSLPYTVTASGEYILKSDLTAPSGDNGITIDSGVNNVVINLNGRASRRGRNGRGRKEEKNMAKKPFQPLHAQLNCQSQITNHQ
jgi:hypothetical protein